MALHEASAWRSAAHAACAPLGLGHPPAVHRHPAAVQRGRGGRLTTTCGSGAPSALERVQGFFTGLSGGRAARDPCAAAAREVRQLVLSGEADGRRLGELLDVLLGAQVPFKERLIGGGPWVVVYTRGTLLWQQATAPGKVVNSKNQASQAFDPVGRTVINKAELAGASLYVTASGTYAPQGDGVRTPQTIRASIERGTLHAFGVEIPLPIRGAGLVDVVYLDDTLRVFQDRRGGVAVQIRADVLQGESS